MKKLIGVLATVLVATTFCVAQANQQGGLSTKWEELTAPNFVKAIAQSQGTCVLPFGIIEKHGPHLPLGTDLINVRHAVLDATAKEYSVVFPEYYFGQIFEARQQPGTVSYSVDLQLRLLQETMDEMGRNGCKKIVIVNGHGGNEHLLPFFGQTQLATEHDYVVYVIGLPNLDVPGRPPVVDKKEMHGGGTETSHMLAARPDLVKIETAKDQSGADLNRQTGLPPNVYTGIWWYAKFPNHYSGDGSLATKELGQFDMKTWSDQIATAVKAIKADTASAALQKQFYEDAKHPIQTKQ